MAKGKKPVTKANKSVITKVKKAVATKAKKPAVPKAKKPAVPKAKKPAVLKAKKPAAAKAKQPVRSSRRLKKLAPIPIPCNPLFCRDPKCRHGKNGNKANKTNNAVNKHPALKRIQKPAISKKKPAKCQKKKTNRRRRPQNVYNRFVAHVCKRFRDSGKKGTMTQQELYKQAAHCWKALTPQQKEIFKCGGTQGSQIQQVGSPPGCPPAPRPPPDNPPQTPAPQPAAPQVPPTPNPGSGLFVGSRPARMGTNPNRGTGLGNFGVTQPPNSPYFFRYGNLPF